MSALLNLIPLTCAYTAFRITEPTHDLVFYCLTTDSSNLDPDNIRTSTCLKISNALSSVLRLTGKCLIVAPIAMISHNVSKSMINLLNDKSMESDSLEDNFKDLVISLAIGLGISTTAVIWKLCTRCLERP